MQHSAQLQSLIDCDAFVRTVGKPDPRCPPNIKSNPVQLLGMNHQLLTCWPTIPGAQYDVSQIGERNANYQTWGLNNLAPVL